MADNIRDKAFEDYKAGMSPKGISDKYGINYNTAKSWARRFKEGARVQKGALQGATGASDAPKKNKASAAEDATKNHAVSVISKSEELNEKQRLFCVYWVNNKNAKLAAIKAGYAPENAHVQGSQLLKNPKIRAYIEAYISDVARNVMLDTSEIVERYMKIAFSDMTDFVDFYQESVPLIIGNKIATTIDLEKNKEVPIMRTVNTIRFKDSMVVDGGLICEISHGKDGAKIKLEDRQKALDWLAKFFFMNPMDKHRKKYDEAILEMRNRELIAKEKALEDIAVSVGDTIKDIEEYLKQKNDT